jgi:type IV secretion system protein TrbI
MADETVTTKAEPELKKRQIDPKGVMMKHGKVIMFLGVAALLLIATLFSAKGKPASAHADKATASSQLLAQDNTESNVADLHNHVADQQHSLDQATGGDPALTNATPAQRAAASAYGANGQATPCIPGQQCVQTVSYGYPQSGGGASNLTPAEQASQQLAAKERERADQARFASNLAYSRPPDSPQSSQVQAAAFTPGSDDANPSALAANQSGGSLITPRAAGQPAAASADTFKRKPEVNIDSASSQPYVLYEGATIDTVLMNRLDGDAVGPVKVLVSNPIYSHDHQHVLIPEGAIAIGEAKKIGVSGFGQQRRMAVSFHRLIMPDGYSVDLDQFHGLDQIGEEGLKDKVNNHYLQIFGASIALGVIAGAAQITQGGGVYTSSGSAVFTNGAASSVSQSATTVLDRFMQIPPTITIREGHRVKVYITQDLLLPAYENHTIPGSF